MVKEQSSKYKHVAFFTIITLLIVIADQISKYFVVKLNPVTKISILTIHLVKNTGAGFGILKGLTLLLGVISLAVALALIFYYTKIPQKKVPQLLFALFLGGVIGNLIDRFFRGFVVDFIDFSFWPAFNIADAAIVVSVIGILIYFWKEGHEEK